MKRRKLLAVTLILGLLLFATAAAETPDEMDLYSPEIYDATAEIEPTAAEPLAGEAPAAYAVAAPELVPMGAPQTVALTGKKASAQMNVGETLQIVVGEGETGTFASKKTKYAAVDANGLVTALAKGKARIEFKPNGGKKRTLNITVVDPYEPKGVTIAQGKAAAINVGETLQLGAVLSPETAKTALTWSSSKAKVAAVDAGGLVTGLAEGKAKITVKTANKKKATVTVTVSDPYKPSGVSIAEGGSITVGEWQGVQLNAVLAPASAVTTLTWKSSKPKVASVSATGWVIGEAPGKATITVTTANGKKARCKVTVSPKPATYELSDFFGVKLSKLRKKFGFSGMGNDEIEFGSFTGAGEPEYVQYCCIKSDPQDRFRIFGVSLGEDIAGVDGELNQNGWTLAENGGAKRFFTYKYDDFDYKAETTVWYDEHGAVTKVEAYRYL